MYQWKILFLLCLWAHILSFNNSAVAEEISSRTVQGNADSLWSAIREKLGHDTQKKPEALGDKDAVQIKADQEELEKVPNQMAPIDKPLVYLHPKINERWVLKEEG